MNNRIKTHWLWDTRLTEVQVKKILKNENDPRFIIYAEYLFSRVIDPVMVFSYVSKEDFCKHWPEISRRVRKDAWAQSKAEFWQTVYEKFTSELQNKIS